MLRGVRGLLLQGRQTLFSRARIIGLPRSLDFRERRQIRGSCVTDRPVGWRFPP